VAVAVAMAVAVAVAVAVGMRGESWGWSRRGLHIGGLAYEAQLVGKLRTGSGTQQWEGGGADATHRDPNRHGSCAR
jgi:hypothetical protein